MKKCVTCSQAYTISDQDSRFYKHLDLPEPTLCPHCRQQKRLAWRNERNMYKRTCDYTGEQIISMYPPDSPFKVYKSDIWWSDKWNALEYGREFDFNRPFFEQFRELQLEVPRLALVNKQSENAQYTNHAGQNKNCYLSGCIFGCEDVHYSDWIMNSKDLVDCSYIIEHCEQGYEVYYAWESQRAFFCDFIHSCANTWFCFDCRHCTDCFLCWNLRNKQYYWKNEQLTKEEFEKRMQEMVPLGYDQLQELRAEYKQIKDEVALRPGTYDVNTEDSTGDLLFDTKGSYECYDCINMEDSQHCTDTIDVRDSMDLYHVGWSELMYECHAMINAYHCIGCHFAYDCKYAYYSDCTQNCSYVFGCCGLNQQKYCILNKQYSENEWNDLVPKIIEHMKASGEWGQFFPYNFSPFAYNQSRAQEYEPLTREQAHDRDIPFSDYKPEEPEAERVITSDQLPQTIEEIPDDVLNWAIRCETTDRPFKITKQEYAFYKKYGLPIPRRHPDQRFDDRMSQRNPRKLWKRNCNQCDTEIDASFPPDSKANVVCGECYRKEVY